jgi:cell division protein FtsZ
MGMPFTDLCYLVRQRSADCAFAVAETSGPNRAAEAVERLLAHPMVDGPESLAQAAAAAVCVLGGPSLGMLEVNRIMDNLRTRSKDAPVLMGAAIAPEMGDRLLVGLLLGRAERGQGAGEASAVPADDRLGEESPDSELTQHLVDRQSTPRPQSRFVPPPPDLSPDRVEQLRIRQGPSGARPRKPHPRMRQGTLPLEIISKGRFDKSEPTIHKGEDLDVPTYIRRGVALN